MESFFNQLTGTYVRHSARLFFHMKVTILLTVTNGGQPWMTPLREIWKKEEKNAHTHNGSLLIDTSIQIFLLSLSSSSILFVNVRTPL